MVYQPYTYRARRPRVTGRQRRARNALLLTIAAYAGAGLALVALCAFVLALVLALDYATSIDCARLWGTRLCP